MNQLFGVRVTSFNPAHESKRENEGIHGLFNKSGVLSSTPFEFDKHGKVVHKWCNKSYSAKFWNMAGSYEQFVDYYNNRPTTEGFGRSMFFLNDKPLAFTEPYPIIGSNLEPHIPNVTDRDFGIHFLMAPPRKIAEKFREAKRSISFFTLREAIGNLFRSGQIDRIFAEPDKENHKACYLAKFVEFSFVKEVQFSDRTALLFSLNKNEFKDEQHFF